MVRRHMDDAFVKAAPDLRAGHCWLGLGICSQCAEIEQHSATHHAPYCNMLAAMTAPLENFLPALQAWFSQRFAAPTAVQQQAWPRIAAGEHVLATAPTGSGKTLTAFLWALHQFATGAWRPGQTRVLYVSPLKALNNDIQQKPADGAAERPQGRRRRRSQRLRGADPFGRHGARAIASACSAGPRTS